MDSILGPSSILGPLCLQPRRNPISHLAKSHYTSKPMTSVSVGTLCTNMWLCQLGCSVTHTVTHRALPVKQASSLYIYELKNPILLITILSKLIYKLNVAPPKMPSHYSEVDKSLGNANNPEDQDNLEVKNIVH